MVVYGSIGKTTVVGGLDALMTVPGGEWMTRRRVRPAPDMQ
jgi:hypothetical protein